MPYFSSSDAFFLLLFCVILSASSATISTANKNNRRVLHQPFFPSNSQPPSQPPDLSPPAPVPATPKYPFSGTAPPNEPFFPSVPSPPSPPSPTSFASFPANISSLSLPQSSKSKPTSSKLIAAAIAAVLAALLVVSIVVFLHIRKRRRRRSPGSHSDTKTQRSENSSRYNYVNANPSANGSIPKLQRPSQTSSEFLYLGTLVNSHAIDNGQHSTKHKGRTSAASDTTSSDTRKLDSPELRPLPPLSTQTYNQRRNPEQGSRAEDEYEEFYSPRGSLGGRESSIGTGSASRTAFAAVQLEDFAGLCSSSSSSYSSSSSASGSPIRSVSLSISPPVSLSPKASRPKSPELVAVQTALPPRDPPTPFSHDPLANQKESRSPSLSPSRSPSPPSSTSPERIYSRSRDSSPRTSNFSDNILDSPVQTSFPGTDSFPSPPSPPPISISNQPAQAVSVPEPPVPPISVPRPPPPPPPPPPSKHWESPRTPTPVAKKTVTEPPVLIRPLKPMSIESPSLISPIQLPSNLDPVEKNDEVIEETPKPKLKPLHWDKVRASSDREMVWDQLKSSSFKYDKPPPSYSLRFYYTVRRNPSLSCVYNLHFFHFCSLQIGRGDD